MGASIALELAAAGYDVAIAARTLNEATRPKDYKSMLNTGSLSTLEAVAAGIEQHGAEALAVRMDLADLDSVAIAADTVLATFGRCDVLVNNGVYQGPGSTEFFLDTAISVFETHLRADVVAPGLLIQKLVPGMVARGSGFVVNMSSYVASNDPPGTVKTNGWTLSYAAGKAGIDRFAGVLNQELAGTGVVTFNVEPGFVAYGPALEDSLTKYPGMPVSPPEAIGTAVRWLVTTPGAERLAGKRIHLPAVATKNGLVPGWEGPGTRFATSFG